MKPLAKRGTLYGGSGEWITGKESQNFEEKEKTRKRLFGQKIVELGGTSRRKEREHRSNKLKNTRKKIEKGSEKRSEHRKKFKLIKRKDGEKKQKKNFCTR